MMENQGLPTYGDHKRKISVKNEVHMALIARGGPFK